MHPQIYLPGNYPPRLSKPTREQIRLTVAAYDAKRSDFEGDAANLQTRLLANSELKKLVHSIKWRAKDPTHLHDKLCRKADKAREAGKPFTITEANLFDRLGDLAGVRILHLHMRQMETIHPLIMKILANEGYVIAENPHAKTWDPEYKVMFKNKLRMDVEFNPALYTSVHYVIRQNKTNKRRCELQVRTLAEEIWGEISHTINYPHETDSVAC